MPAQRADEFAQAVQAIMAPGMERLGYHLEQQLLPGNLPYSFFSKVMADGTFALSNCSRSTAWTRASSTSTCACSAARMAIR